MVELVVDLRRILPGGIDLQAFQDAVQRAFVEDGLAINRSLGVPTTIQRSDYTAVMGEYVRVDPSQGSRVIRLPSIQDSQVGGRITVKNASDSSNIITVQQPSGVTIDGLFASRVMTNARGMLALLAASPTDWDIVDEYPSTPSGNVTMMDITPGATYSTVSGTFVDIHSSITDSFTIATPGTYFCQLLFGSWVAPGSGAIPNTANVRLRLVFDTGESNEQTIGNDDATWNNNNPNINDRDRVTIPFFVTLTQGSHTVKIQWKRTFGDGEPSVDSENGFLIMGVLT